MIRIVMFILLLLSGCVEQHEIVVELPQEKVIADEIYLRCTTDYPSLLPCSATIRIGNKYQNSTNAYIEVSGEGKTMKAAWNNALAKMSCIQPNCIKKAGK